MTSRKGTRRACDPCSVRKVRCDGEQPCARCRTASYDCTYHKIHGKSGPKGPRRATEAAIRRFQERSRGELSQRTTSDSDTSLDDGSPTTTIDFPLHERLPPTSEPPHDQFVWPDAISPPLQEHRAPRKISTSTISPYLEVFQARGYAIWPVVDTEALLARLLTEPDDMESYGLATAICAATITQFQIDAEPGSPFEGHFRVSSGMFDSEAKRAREVLDHQEHITLSSVLTAFFLHVYNANVGRMPTSTVLLGEAVTKAHMIGLHKPAYYNSMDVERLQYNVRIYWLLFITERYVNSHEAYITPTNRCFVERTRSKMTCPQCLNAAQRFHNSKIFMMAPLHRPLSISAVFSASWILLLLQTPQALVVLLHLPNKNWVKMNLRVI